MAKTWSQETMKALLDFLDNKMRWMFLEERRWQESRLETAVASVRREVLSSVEELELERRHEEAARRRREKRDAEERRTEAKIRGEEPTLRAQTERRRRTREEWERGIEAPERTRWDGERSEGATEERKKIEWTEGEKARDVEGAGSESGELGKREEEKDREEREIREEGEKRWKKWKAVQGEMARVITELQKRLEKMREKVAQGEERESQRAQGREEKLGKKEGKTALKSSAAKEKRAESTLLEFKMADRPGQEDEERLTEQKEREGEESQRVRLSWGCRGGERGGGREGGRGEGENLFFKPKV